MTRAELCRKLQNDTLTLDEVRSLPYKLDKETIADILVELTYALYVECGVDEHKANRALLACLLERWWEEVEET